MINFWTYRNVKKDLKKSDLSKNITIPKSWGNAFKSHMDSYYYTKKNKKNKGNDVSKSYETLVNYIYSKQLDPTHTLNTDTLDKLHTNFGKDEPNKEIFIKKIQDMLHPPQTPQTPI